MFTCLSPRHHRALMWGRKMGRVGASKAGTEVWVGANGRERGDDGRCTDGF